MQRGPAGPERPDESLGIHAVYVSNGYLPSVQTMSWLLASKGPLTPLFSVLEV